MRVRRNSLRFRIFAVGNADIFNVNDRLRVFSRKHYSVWAHVQGLRPKRSDL